MLLNWLILCLVPQNGILLRGDCELQIFTSRLDKQAWLFFETNFSTTVMISIKKYLSGKICAMIVFSLMQLQLLWNIRRRISFWSKLSWKTHPLFSKTRDCLSFQKVSVAVFYRQNYTEKTLVAFGSSKAILLGGNCRKLLTRTIYFKYRTGFLLKTTGCISDIKVLIKNIANVEENSIVLFWETFLSSETLKSEMAYECKRFRVFLKNETMCFPKAMAAFGPSGINQQLSTRKTLRMSQALHLVPGKGDVVRQKKPKT